MLPHVALRVLFHTVVAVDHGIWREGEVEVRGGKGRHMVGGEGEVEVRGGKGRGGKGWEGEHMVIYMDNYPRSCGKGWGRRGMVIDMAPGTEVRGGTW